MCFWNVGTNNQSPWLQIFNRRTHDIMLLRSWKYELMLRQSHQCGHRIKILRVWFNDHLISQVSYEAAEPVIVVIQANYTWKKCNRTPSHLWDFLKINDFSQCFEFAFQNWIYLPASCDTFFDKFSSWSVRCFMGVDSEFLTVHHSRFKLTFIWVLALEGHASHHKACWALTFLS